MFRATGLSILLVVAGFSLVATPAAADEADCSGDRAIDAHTHEGWQGLPTSNPAFCYDSSKLKDAPSPVLGDVAGDDGVVVQTGNVDILIHEDDGHIVVDDEDRDDVLIQAGNHAVMTDEEQGVVVTADE